MWHQKRPKVTFHWHYDDIKLSVKMYYFCYIVQNIIKQKYDVILKYDMVF